MYTREVNYHGAVIRVEWDRTPSARLYINNLERDADSIEQGDVGVIRLNSTVQTDYEWHEFVEAVVSYEANQSSLVLTANRRTLIDDIERTRIS